MGPGIVTLGRLLLLGFSRRPYPSRLRLHHAQGEFPLHLLALREVIVGIVGLRGRLRHVPGLRRRVALHRPVLGAHPPFIVAAFQVSTGTPVDFTRAASHLHGREGCRSEGRQNHRLCLTSTRPNPPCASPHSGLSARTPAEAQPPIYQFRA